MSSSASPVGPAMHQAAAATAVSSSSSWSYASAFPPLQSFPWSIPHPNHHKKHAHHAGGGLPPPPALHQSLAPPKYPLYLKHTLYAELVLEQYNYLQSRRSFFPLSSSDHKSSSPVTTTQNRSASYHSVKEGGTAAAVKVLTSAPLLFCLSLERIDLRLPTCWNQNDKSRYIDIGRNGLDLTYSGPGKDDKHAASVRANFPMRPQCGVFYFEIRVVSKGDDGYIGIGFCGPDEELDRLPGWDAGSWGYHGDDGNSFAGQEKGQRYGPCFTTGDVIGCGVNFADGTAFYTKNGTFLGVAFSNLPIQTKELYPCVGLRTAGEHVTANFGTEPFLFDIVQYIKDCKTAIWETVGCLDVPSTANEKELFREEEAQKMNELVLSYLVHHGYVGAAKTMVKDAEYVAGRKLSLWCEAPDKGADITDGWSADHSEQDMLKRQSIRAAVISGNIDLAINLTEQSYPNIFTTSSKGQDVLFELKCRKFVEMMLDYSTREHHHRHDLQHRPQRESDVVAATEDDKSSVSSYNNNFIAEDDFPDDNSSVTSFDRRKSVSGTAGHGQSSSMHVPGRRRRLSYAAVAASASSSSSGNGFLAFPASPTTGEVMNSSAPAIPMVMDHDSWEDDHALSGGRRPRRLSRRRSSTSSSVLSVGSHSYFGGHELPLGELELDEEEEEHDSAPAMMKRIMKYGQQLQEEYRHDDRPKIRERLMEIFSLLAYPDLHDSPVAHLMQRSRRDELATELNAAILYYQSRQEMASLERIYRQAIVTNQELAYAGHGKAVMIDVKNRCADSAEDGFI